MNKKDEALVKFVEVVTSTTEDEFEKKYIREAQQEDKEQDDDKEED